jgi:hypothetical protein
MLTLLHSRRTLLVPIGERIGVMPLSELQHVRPQCLSIDDSDIREVRQLDQHRQGKAQAGHYGRKV